MRLILRGTCNMGKNIRRGPLDISLDPTQIPSFRARFNKIDQTSSQLSMSKMPKADISDAKDTEPLAAKIGSHQDIRSNPGIILRRWGLKK